MTRTGPKDSDGICWRQFIQKVTQMGIARLEREEEAVVVR